MIVSSKNNPVVAVFQAINRSVDGLVLYPSKSCFDFLIFLSDGCHDESKRTELVFIRVQVLRLEGSQLLAGKPKRVRQTQNVHVEEQTYQIGNNS